MITASLRFSWGSTLYIINDHDHHHNCPRHNDDGEPGLDVEPPSYLPVQSIFPPVAKWPPALQQGQKPLWKNISCVFLRAILPPSSNKGNIIQYIFKNKFFSVYTC